MARAPLAAFGGAGGVAYAGAAALADGQTIRADGATLRALHTPGHAADHLCFWLEEERALFTGDHVLGRGTSVIAWPDGDMTAYLSSLERARAASPSRLYPGHGPVVEEPKPVLDYYVEHRLERERQVLDALDAGCDTISAMVERIYADVDAALHPTAALSVRAHLHKLAQEGRADGQGGRWRRR
jgi:glyoxylase-like metal-dependent hydrolase (beta-lactamase superfamily II)